MADTGLSTNFTNFTFRPTAPRGTNPFASPEVKQRFQPTTERNFSFLQSDTVNLSNNTDSDFQQVQNQSFALRNFQRGNFVNSNATTEPTPPANAEGGGDKKVTVQRDDSLSKILLRMGYPREKALDSKLHDEVASKNKLPNKNLIRPGQTLMIPEFQKAQNSPTDSTQPGQTTETPKKAPTNQTPQPKKTSTPQSKTPLKAQTPQSKEAKQAQLHEKKSADFKFATRKVKDHMVSQGWAPQHISVTPNYMKADGTMLVIAQVNNPADERHRKSWQFEVVHGKIKGTTALN